MSDLPPVGTVVDVHLRGKVSGHIGQRHIVMEVAGGHHAVCVDHADVTVAEPEWRSGDNVEDSWGRLLRYGDGSWWYGAARLSTEPPLPLTRLVPEATS